MLTIYQLIVLLFVRSDIAVALMMINVRAIPLWIVRTICIPTYCVRCRDYCIYKLSYLNCALLKHLLLIQGMIKAVSLGISNFTDAPSNEKAI